MLNTQTLNLVDGQSYYVDVIALNGQGQPSQVVTSGPILYDASPPPTPTVTAAYSSGAVQLTIFAQTDPQSGFLGYQVAVGSTSTGDDEVAWETLPWTQPGWYLTPITVALPAGTLRPITYWVQIRTVNGAGVPSAIAQTSFPVGGVPIYTPPAPKLP